MKTKAGTEGLYEFLRTFKGKGIVSSRDLSGDEITMAEELVSLKLLDKTSTRLASFYSYGKAPETDLPKGLKDE